MPGSTLMAADLLFTETTRTRQTLREQLRAIRVAESEAVADAQVERSETGVDGTCGVALLFAWALVRSTKRRPCLRTTSLRSPRTVSLMPAERTAAAMPLPCRSTCLRQRRCARQSAGFKPKQTCRTCWYERRRCWAPPVWSSGWSLERRLFPVAAHGYDSRQLRQLGSIGRSSLNATAAAWRTGALQTVAGESSSRSAIVAPLLGVDRCIGALAIEVAPGRESDANTGSRHADCRSARHGARRMAGGSSGPASAFLRSSGRAPRRKSRPSVIT